MKLFQGLREAISGFARGGSSSSSEARGEGGGTELAPLVGSSSSSGGGGGGGGTSAADASSGSSVAPSLARATGSRYASGTSDDPDSKTAIWLTALNIMNGVLGAGILGLPWAMAQSGLPMGIIICVFVAILSNWTLRLLVNMGRAHGATTYEDLTQRAFGPAGFAVAVAMQALFSFGSMASYLVILGDTLPPVLGQLTSWGTTAPALVNRRVVIAAVAFTLMLPLSLYRAFGRLAKYSFLKFLAASVMVVTVCVFARTLNVPTAQSHDWKYRDVHGGFFPAIGTFAFAFVCHHQTFLAYRSLRRASRRRFAIVSHVATLGALILSLTLGIAGYATFWESTSSDIFNSYTENEAAAGSPLLQASRLLLCVTMVLTFPGDMLVARGVLEHLLARRRRRARWLALRAPVHDGRLLAALKTAEDEDAASSADRWRLRDGCTRGLIEHVSLTFGLFGAALVVALATDNLGVVLQVSGSFTAVFIAFVLPAAIRLRLGPEPDDVMPLSHRNNWPVWGVLAFGMLALVTSTVGSLLGLAGLDLIIGK